jgi:hypothetical protein
MRQPTALRGEDHARSRDGRAVRTTGGRVHPAHGRAGVTKIAPRRRNGLYTHNTSKRNSHASWFLDAQPTQGKARAVFGAAVRSALSASVFAGATGAFLSRRRLTALRTRAVKITPRRCRARPPGRRGLRVAARRADKNMVTACSLIGAAFICGRHG